MQQKDFSSKNGKQHRLLNMVVRDLLTSFPRAVPLFLRHRMACVGCCFSPFDTLEDALRIYAIPREPFLEELKTLTALPQGELD